MGQKAKERGGLGYFGCGLDLRSRTLGSDFVETDLKFKVRGLRARFWLFFGGLLGKVDSDDGGRSEEHTSELQSLV